MSDQLVNHRLALSKKYPEYIEYPEYPDNTSQNPDFQQTLYNKLEFYEHSTSKTTSRPIGSIYYPHQEYLKNYIAPNTPYERVFLFHATGTGKTCAAIAIAEGFLDDRLHTNRKILVLTGGPSIRDNFKSELKMCGSPEYQQIHQREYTSDRLTDFNKKYYFQQYDVFVEKVLGKRPENAEEDKTPTAASSDTESEMNTKEVADKRKKAANRDVETIKLRTLDNFVIIVDEVHNMLQSEDRYAALTKILNNSRNVRLVLLSATPIYNDVTDVSRLIKLVKPWSTMPTEKSDFMKTYFGEDAQINLASMSSAPPQLDQDTEKELLNEFTGFISHIRAYDPNLIPMKRNQTRKYPPLKTGEKLDEHERSLFCVNLTPRQNKKYKAIPSDKLFKNQDKLLQTCLFTYPEEDKKFDDYFDKILHEVKRKDDPNKTRKLLRYNLKSGVDGDGDFLKYYKSTETGLKAGSNKFNFALRGLVASLPPKYNNYFKNNHTELYENAQEYNKLIKSRAGPCFVHSQYKMEGVVLFCKILEANGFINYEDRRTNPSKLANPKARPRYLMITGDNQLTDLNREAEYLRFFNSQKNQFGEEISVIVGTRRLAEGITLKNINQIHIMEPWWNLSRIDQTVGRGIRLNSHRHFYQLLERGKSVEDPAVLTSTAFNTLKTYGYRLTHPDSNKNMVETRDIETIKKLNNQVKIFKYCAKLPATDRTEAKNNIMTIDEQMYKLAYFKDKVIKQIENLMRRAAIDCPNNYERNLLDHRYNNSRECDYKPCAYECHGITNTEQLNPKNKYRYTTNNQQLAQKLDRSTYRAEYQTARAQRIRNQLQALYSLNFIYDLDEIVERLSKNDPFADQAFIEDVVTDILEANPPITFYDMYNHESRLTYQDGYYVLVPMTFEDPSTVPIAHMAQPTILYDDPDWQRTTDLSKLPELVVDAPTPVEQVPQPPEQPTVPIQVRDDDTYDGIEAMIDEYDLPFVGRIQDDGVFNIILQEVTKKRKTNKDRYIVDKSKCKDTTKNTHNKSFKGKVCHGDSNIKKEDLKGFFNQINDKLNKKVQLNEKSKETICSSIKSSLQELGREKENNENYFVFDSC